MFNMEKGLRKVRTGRKARMQDRGQIFWPIYCLFLLFSFYTRFHKSQGKPQKVQSLSLSNNKPTDISLNYIRTRYHNQNSLLLDTGWTGCRKTTVSIYSSKRWTSLNLSGFERKPESVRRLSDNRGWGWLLT